MFNLITRRGYHVALPLRLLRSIVVCGIHCVVFFTGLSTSNLHGSDWTYVGSSEEAGFSQPLFRSISLSTVKPEIEVKVTYRGKTQKYAWLRYGSPNSQRIALVLDEVSRRDFDIYVDLDRNQAITSGEKLDGSGRLRQLKLEAQLANADGSLEMFPRQVAIRRGITSKSLSFATLGFIEGVVLLDGRQLRARRVDGDGDGFFSTGRDRMWLDLDADGQWDAFAEQFPHLPIAKLNGRRYAVRGDVAGKRLELSKLDGTGTIRLGMKLHDPKAAIVALDVMLVGADGSAVSLTGTDEAVVVPTGKYTVNIVRLAVKDSITNRPWDFVFSDMSEQGSGGRSFTVVKGQELLIDPIGKLRFELESENGMRSVKPGTLLSVSPRLYTADGLLINSSTCGSSATNEHGADIWLRDNKGGRLSMARSGFA